ncbi:MAG: RIO1 family regulatory kinase/ATPase [Gudongella sp.]|nr:RIO1 family regulatory kinase/ATPase [Gudongella sp.]
MYQEIALTSKKNKVYRIVEVDNTYILKTLRDTKSYDKELEVLKLLNDKGLLVPKILNVNKYSITLEDLGEVTLLSIYEKLENNNDKNYQHIIESLLSWLDNFYKVAEDYYRRECVLSDMNFRNFIVKNNRIYRIDFEEVGFGKKEADVGKLLAFGLTYNPEHTEWKKQFEKAFVVEIQKRGLYDMESVIAEKNLELERIKERRKKIENH